MGNLLSPQRQKKRRIILMRIAFIALLVGNGIAIFTSLVYSLNSISVHLGDPSLDWVLKILTFSNSLTLISAALGIAGGILLLIALAKIGQNGSLKLQSTSKIAFLLLIISLTLNFAFSYVLSSLALWGVLDSQGIDSLLSITPLLTIAADSAFYIFLGFTLRQLKIEHQVGTKPLITTFIYPITFALRLILMFDLFSSIITELIASLVISVMGLVILIIFFSRALIDLKRVKNKISDSPSTQILPSRRDAKFCAKCGAPIEPIGDFCASCGHPIE